MVKGRVKRGEEKGKGEFKGKGGGVEGWLKYERGVQRGNNGRKGSSYHVKEKEREKLKEKNS